MNQSPNLAGPREADDGARAVAGLLVRTGAVGFRVEPFFTFTSGVSSPVYVDNRRLLGFVPERRQVVSALVGLATEHTSGRIDAIAGTATAGIPWASWMAEELALPLLYVRSQAKEWGQQRAVEGVAPSGAQVVLVEDLAFSGGSLLSAADKLRSADFVVAFCVTIVTYGMPSAAVGFDELSLHHQSLTTVDIALEEAVIAGALDPNAGETVRRWLASERDAQTSRIEGGEGIE